MNEYLVIIISAGVGGIVGFFLANFKNKAATSTLEERQSQLGEKISELQSVNLQVVSEKEKIREEKDFFQNQLSMKGVEYDNLLQKNNEQKEEVAKLQKKFTKDFEILANKILEEKSTKFTEQNKENIKNILNPLQEKIKTFEEKVDKTHKESIDYHAALRQQIFGLKELNQQMSKETLNLTKALKGDSKMQGNWGELVLERVLEKSGLEKDREYLVQQSFTLEDGSRVLPDVIINLPGNKKMIVDSKVSLTYYERYINTDDEEQQVHLNAHVNSIKKHIGDLSDKNYQDIYDIESPDFVLLFIPIEPAFAVALNQDNSLYNKAFEKNIVIVTPTTLLATLRTIDSMWNSEKQQQNAIEIATQAGRLYDQFVNLTDDLIKVGNQLKTVQGSYDGTMKKLTGKGNLISKVEKIKQLGIKQNKQLNEKLVKRTLSETDDE